jgi:DNA ligase 1
MDDHQIIEVLSKVPKQALIKCAEIFLEKKNKKKESLVTEVKNKKQDILDKIANPFNNKPTIKQTIKPTIKPKMSGSENVMLAHCYDPDKHARKVVGWWISIKYDGVRAKWNGEEMETRTGRIYTLPDFFTEQLRSITDEDGNPMELDGELWAGNDTQAFMSGMARRFENNDELWGQITYMVFDTPDTTIPFEDRVRKVAAALKRAGKLENVKGVRHFKFKPEEGMSIEEELKKVEDDGGEGLVLRKPKSSYVFKRSQDMLKVKSWTYKEAVVYGYEAGKEGITGKMLGLVGSLLVKSNEFGEDDEDDTKRSWVNFKVGSGLNDWQRYTGDMQPELSKLKKWTVDLQKKLDILRKKMKKPIDKNSEAYRNIVETIKTASGKERTDALHALNELFTQMPVIGDVVTFRFKELTKDGNPSMPTFVNVRDYE